MFKEHNYIVTNLYTRVLQLLKLLKMVEQLNWKLTKTSASNLYIHEFHVRKRAFKIFWKRFYF